MSTSTTNIFNRHGYADYMQECMDIDKGLNTLADATHKLFVMRDQLTVMRDQLAAASKNVKATVEDLHKAPKTLAGKDAVMISMCIIPVSLAAIYLNVSEDSLHDFRRNTGDMFGEKYGRKLCFSMNELKVFEKHRNWFSDNDEGLQRDRYFAPPVFFLFFGTYVDENFLSGYFSDDRRFEQQATRRNGTSHRPYRLSDIRSEFINLTRNKANMPFEAMNIIPANLPKTALTIGGVIR